MHLTPVDRLEIVVLMDNLADNLLESSELVIRPPISNNGWIHTTPLVAEHGLSLLITLFAGEKKQTVLLDAAWNGVGLANNMKRLGISPEAIETIVLSHGHIDHCGGLSWLLDQISHSVSVVAHPDAFIADRYLEWEGKFNLIAPDRQGVIDSGAQVIETKTPYISPDGLWGATGQIPRVTEFEKGLPNAYLERDGVKEVDQILDDQAIVISLKNKGLVMIAGCAHSGIINSIQYGQEITDLKSVFAVFGGFHLAGPTYEAVQDQTMAALRDIDPELIVPMHCTGFATIARMSREFPDQHVTSCVGSKFILGASE
ncbi:MAG: MBL fold metallo-hydrolase [Deltaproteobacteria bacterium]|nr:MBL fold metallo-hydrolase [Deltaproteobacteria bacterium]MBT4640851.1 MBL fold metallo-hydrolase [Deltaproteobacteria bacterium]MBT6502372.1 MBL fold metallo-hydrolase [Deltaproteobacteria bacterium]MBT6615813.1 MBL fold metallo-hydrolase [Deltaproteobacteria bacterium]MBT7155871.1 MBL fold metallo-hydrolase [Deltaproteobacteria bacterium]